MRAKKRGREERWDDAEGRRMSAQQSQVSVSHKSKGREGLKERKTDRERGGERKEGGTSAFNLETERLEVAGNSQFLEVVLKGESVMLCSC